MIISLLLVAAAICVGSSSASPWVDPRAHHVPHVVAHPENNTPLNYTIKPRNPNFKLHAIDITGRSFLKCSKKGKKITLGYGEYAVFESPDYPDEYPKKTCKWELKSSDPITIECFNFELEEGNNGECKKDKLTIDSMEYCGRDQHFYYFGGEKINVEFKSDKKNNYGGFFCLAYVLEWEYGQSSTWAPSTTPESTELPQTDDPDAPCTCGEANQGSRIVGGKETKENEFPWQAAMVYKHSTAVFCGASVIGSKHILTAAHCTQAAVDYNIDYQVLLGAHSLSSAASSQMIMDASDIIQHEDYDSWTMDADIAIIVLKKSISFQSSEIRPICLPENDDDDYKKVDAIVSGWGNLEEGGEQPDVLMEVTVPTMSNSKCDDYYGGGISDVMICAGYKQGGKDSCQGDSGGPLITKTGSYYTLIGVVSWGAGCAQAEAPGVYVRVTKFLSWISDNTASSNTCPAP